MEMLKHSGCVWVDVTQNGVFSAVPFWASCIIARSRVDTRVAECLRASKRLSTNAIMKIPGGPRRALIGRTALQQERLSLLPCARPIPQGLSTDVINIWTWRLSVPVKAKFHYASWFEAGSKLVRSWFEAGRRQASIR